MNISARVVHSWLGVALAAIFLAPGAQAVPTLQAKFAAAQSAIPASSLSYPYRVAVDASGDVYISNTQGNEVLKETWSAATQRYIESVVVSSGLATPYGVAVDASGNVYVADNGHNRVVKEAPSGSGYTQTVVTTSALSYPTGVAVDASGNLYIADTGHGRILKEVPSGSSYTETALTYSSNFAQITGIAVDASGDIFVSDIDNWAVYEETYSAGSYTPSTVPTSGLNYPYDIAVDGSGNLYIADFTNKRIVEETYISAGNYTQSVFPTANLAGPLGLAADGGGNLYIADTFGQTIEKETLAGGNFDTVQVGSVSSTISMLFSFAGGSTGSTISLSGISVLTQGAAGLDFAPSGSGGCSTSASYSAGDSCFVNVALTPQYPGQRYGAVELFGTFGSAQVARPNGILPRESAGSLLATGLLTGLGIGPQVNFLPFSFSTLSRVAGSFSPYDLPNPFDSVVDGSGNVYVADYNNNAVYEETLSAGSYSQSTVATGLSNPEALALDGAGNLYIVDSGNNQILKESQQNGSWVQSTVVAGLDFPTGVAVDAYGNVYFSSFNDNAVYELAVSPGGYSPPVALVTGLNEPRKIALDGNGDIFIADTNNNRVVEEVPNGEGYSETVVGSGMRYPYAVAVGAAGQVYVADTINSRILLETPSGEGFTQSLLIPGPPAYGIAVDGQGNIYFPDLADATVFKVAFSEPPGFSFASTLIGDTSSDSPQSFSVWNVGNATLDFPVPGSGTNPSISDGFELDASTTCPEVTASSTAGSLAADATCVYAVDFKPTVVSSYSGSLTLTDNSSHVTGGGPQFKSEGQALGGATQTIALTGTGLPLPATKLALSGVPAAILAGGNLGSATVDVENVDSAIVTGSSAPVTVTVTGPGGYSQAVSGAAASGVYSANLSGLSLAVVGVYTVTASSASLTAATATVVVEPAPASLGSIPVGTASGAIIVTFPFANAVTLGSPGVKVLTQGAAGLDFENAGTGTCTAGATIGAGGACTVAVTFAPSYPGPRYGAVLLEDASGNVLATAYLHGVGVGPQALFPPGTQSTLTPDLTTYWPEGIAVDSKFNLFFVDGNSNYGGGAIIEFPWTGSSYGSALAPASLNLPGSGFSPSGSLAVDGAGNLYAAIASDTSGFIVKFPWNGSTYGAAILLGTGLNYPISVTVDGSGNLFIADPGGQQRILEIPWEGGSANYGYGAQATIADSSALGGNSGQYPTAVAADPSGDLFFIGQTSPTTANLEEIPFTNGNYSSVFVTIDNGLYDPFGVAVDTDGNLYVNDTNAAGTTTPVYEYLLSGGSYGGRTQLFTTPNGGDGPLALDSAGSIYVNWSGGDSDGAIYKQNRTAPPALVFAHSTVIDTPDTADNPQAVALLNYGNANLTFASPSSGTNPAFSGGGGFSLESTTSCPNLSAGAAAAHVNANSACLYQVDFTPDAIGADSGTLILTDNSLNVAGATQSAALSGTGLPLPATKLALGSIPAQLFAGDNLGTLTVDVENVDSGIVTGSSALVTVTVAGPGGFSQAISGTAVNGAFTADFGNYSLTALGAYTVTATSSSLTSASANVQVVAPLVSFGSLAVGTPSGATTVTMPFSVAAMLGNPGVQVVTQGATGLDFANVGTGTCTAGAAIAAGSSCTVVVVFTPKYPGIRYGAVILYDGSGNILETIYLSGVGTGPMVNYSPGFDFPVAGTQSPWNLNVPTGVAVDAQGNVYISDQTQHTVFEAVLTGTLPEISYEETTVASASAGGLSFPRDVAVDGAGNVFIADSGEDNRVLKATKVNGNWVVTPVANVNAPNGIAVDRAGNVYVSSNSDGVVYKEAGSAGIYTQSTVATGLSSPAKVAVDLNGNVFVADAGNNRVVEEAPSGSGYTQSVVGSGMSNPVDVAADSNGNLYVLDYGNKRQLEEFVNGSSYNQVEIFPAEDIAALNVDQQGNLYAIVISPPAVIQLNVNLPSGIDFITPTSVQTLDAADGPQGYTLVNNGNRPLIFSSPSSGTNPSIASPSFAVSNAATCPILRSGGATASLAPYARCTVAATFTPQAVGQVSGQELVSDNNLNVTDAVQSIPLQGEGIEVLSRFTLAGLPASATAGAPVSFTLTARTANGLTITGFGGTVNLTSTDPHAVFSLTAGGAAISSYTFQNAEAGVKTLYVTFKSAGSQTVTAADGAVSATSSVVLVAAGAASSISALGPTEFITTIGAILGVPEVSVADAYGNPVSGVTVTFAAPSSGPSAILSDSQVQTSGGTISVAAYANAIAGGPYKITATAAGLTGSPVNFTGTNLQDSTATNLATSPGSSSVYGTAVTLTATVTPALPGPPDIVRSGARAGARTLSGGNSAPAGSFNGPPAIGPPTGTVSFYDTVGSSTRLLGTSTINGASGFSPDIGKAYPEAKGTPPVAATATFSIMAAVGGGHSYTARYGSDSNFTASASSPAPYTVTLAPVTVAGPAAQPVLVLVDQVGSIPVTVTGSKSGASIAQPTGSLSYTILNAGGTMVGSGTVTLTAAATDSAGLIPTSSTLASGSYTIEVGYEGDGNYAASSTSVAFDFKVGKIPTEIAWPQPGGIVYGSNLSGVLDATAKAGSVTVAGTFAYTASPTGGVASPVTAATVLGAGSYTLAVAFTPTDGTTYATSTGSVMLTVGKAAASISLLSSANPQYVQDPISFTATVDSSAGVPTGSVSLYDGKTLLDRVALASGVAVFTTSSLALGPHSITAVYSGDANFATAASAAVNETVQDFNLTISTTSGGSSSATASPGGNAIYPLVFTPVDGSTFPQVVNLTVSGLPAGATATLTPDTLPAGSGATPVTLTVSLANTTAAVHRSNSFRQNRLPLVLGMILLPFAARLRRVRVPAPDRRYGWILSVLLAVFGLATAVGLAGCGGKPTGYFGQAPETYTLTITGTSGALSHSTTVTLTVE